AFNTGVKSLLERPAASEKWHTPMSALGQKQTCAAQKVMSALPPKADMCGATRDERTSTATIY
ncbi:MAG: hypothetical protein WA866_20995, partial [Pseudolabrys sp.]